MKFLRSPAASLLDAMQSNIVWCLDENHRIALPLPTRFEQHGRIQQNRLTLGLLSAGDLIDDASLDLRMNDLFQVVPGGAMLFGITEDPPGECSSLHIPLRVEDAIAELSSQRGLHVTRHQSVMPEPVGVDDMDVGLSRYPPRDGTLSRADSADNPHDRNVTGGRRRFVNSFGSHGDQIRHGAERTRLGKQHRAKQQRECQRVTLTADPRGGSGWNRPR